MKTAATTSKSLDVSNHSTRRKSSLDISSHSARQQTARRARSRSFERKLTSSGSTEALNKGDSSRTRPSRRNRNPDPLGSASNHSCTSAGRRERFQARRSRSHEKLLNRTLVSRGSDISDISDNSGRNAHMTNKANPTKTHRRLSQNGTRSSKLSHPPQTTRIGNRRGQLVRAHSYLGVSRSPSVQVHVEERSYDDLNVDQAFSKCTTMATFKKTNSSNAPVVKSPVSSTESPVAAEEISEPKDKKISISSNVGEGLGRLKRAIPRIGKSRTVERLLSRKGDNVSLLKQVEM